MAIFYGSDGSFGFSNTADHSLEILLQINITNILHNFENLDFAGVFSEGYLAI